VGNTEVHNNSNSSDDPEMRTSPKKSEVEQLQPKPEMAPDFERPLKFSDQAHIGRGLRNQNQGTKASSDHCADAASSSCVVVSSPSPNIVEDVM
jgi:hypothetical protein